MATFEENYKIITKIPQDRMDDFNLFWISEERSGRFPYAMFDYIPGWQFKDGSLFAENDMIPGTFIEELTALESLFLNS